MKTPILLSLLCVTLCLFNSGCSSTSTQASPILEKSVFARDQTLQQASARASAETKKVLVMFDSGVTEDGVIMEINLLGKNQVSKLVTTQTIPVLIDVTEAPEISSKYHIKTLPTLLLLDPDGKELERWADEDDAKGFAEELVAALQGQSSLEQVRAKLKPTDVRGHLRLAQKLSAIGNYVEALKIYIWICDVAYPPANNGTKNSWKNARYFRDAVKGMTAMQEAFPPAKEALAERNNQAANFVLKNQDNTTKARRFFVLNRALRDDAGLIYTFQKLDTGKSKDVLKTDIFSILGKKKSFEEAVSIWTIDEALASMNNINEAPLVARGIIRVLAPARAGKTLDAIQMQALLRRTNYFVVYASANRTDEARKIAENIIKWDRFDRAPSVLKKSLQAAFGERANEYLRSLNLPALNPDSKA